MRWRPRSTGAARSVFVPLCAAAGAVLVLGSCLNPRPDEFPSRRDLAPPQGVVAPEPEVPQEPGAGSGSGGSGGIGLVDQGPVTPGGVSDAGAPPPDGSPGDAADEGDR
jgi:hypothetical protein